MSITAVALGTLAGGTIFLGLPLAFLRRISPRWRGFLTAMSTGVLVFLLVEITYKVIENIEDLTLSATEGFPVWKDVFFYAGLLAVGLALGMMGLAWFEKIFVKRAKDVAPTEEKNARHVAVMIALGIGLHNFCEGLAIGQAYGWGNAQLAWLLVIGFALHNATEGFGIVGPLAGHTVRWRFLGLLGILGGGPTILGSVLGSFWTLQPLEVLFLSMASGSILYVIGELLHLGRKMKDETVISAGILTGFFLAFITEIIIKISSGDA